MIINFYPRSPCGERLYTSGNTKYSNANFYPRSPCGERPAVCSQLPLYWQISIHALLAESDISKQRMQAQALNISIHALLAESDEEQAVYFLTPKPFLSTLSLRRATAKRNILGNVFRFLSTLSLRRATGHEKELTTHFGISIHALLAESDYNIASTWQRAPGFLSTLSLRRATKQPTGQEVTK